MAIRYLSIIQEKLKVDNFIFVWHNLWFKIFPFCILFFYRAVFIWNNFTEGTVVHFP